MPLTTASVFLAGALLSCLLPITLLICFATFFTRNARRLPPNATPVSTPIAPPSTDATNPVESPPADA
jgi:hypothetical protein